MTSLQRAALRNLSAPAQTSASRSQFNLPSVAVPSSSKLRKQIRFIHKGHKTLFHVTPSQIRHSNPTKEATISYCYNQIRILEAELKFLQAASIQHREECLSQLALDHPGNATSIEAVKEQEKLKRSFRTLKRFIKRNIPTGLDKLEVHTYDDAGNIESTKILTSPDSINQALFAQQHKQFGQAQNTPCVDSEISEILPPFDLPPGTTAQILDGNFHLEDRVQEPMQAVHDFFANLQCPHTSDGSEIDITITSDDFISGFKKVQERISSSPM